jgi:O-acetyl-ADP-ribose deacetylase (regulator of RNase III)
LLPKFQEPTMTGHVFIAHGDITQFAADAVAFSASTSLDRSGSLYPAFSQGFPSFSSWHDALRQKHGGRCQVGDAYWCDLLSDTKPHGLVVIVATGGPRTDEDKAHIAVRAAIDAAVHHLRKTRAGRLLIGLPAFRIGMGGDRNDRLRSAKAQVEAAFDALGRHADVDVVFLCYTPAVYQIFLEARRLILGSPEPCGPEVNSLAQALADGRCVLFVGAGVSRGAGLPDWDNLVAQLAKELDIDDTSGLDPLDVAQWYRERHPADQLAALLTDTFAPVHGKPAPTLAHYLLMGLPIRQVITTNYDDLLERTLTALKRHPVPIVRQEEVSRTGAEEGVYVVKFHGDATHPDEIVITRDDYDAFFEKRPAMALLLEGLLLNQTFFFVGYGLRDPNFRQLYSRIARMVRNASRPAFATAFEAAGARGKYVTQQWFHKGMTLIPIAGQTVPEKEQHLLRFLDRLAEQVALRQPRLFLARDVTVAPPLERLRSLLMEDVGKELTSVIDRGLSELSESSCRHLVVLLEFLTDQGWRPTGWKGYQLCQLWEQVAQQTPHVADKHRLLNLALAAAEGFADVQRIREKLSQGKDHLG